jgi:hypothetical protein
MTEKKLRVKHASFLRISIHCALREFVRFAGDQNNNWKRFFYPINHLEMEIEFQHFMTSAGIRQPSYDNLKISVIVLTTS